MNGGKETRTCFVIMPFGTKKDVARKDKVHFDWVYSRIIEPAVEGLAAHGIRIRCTRSDKIQAAGLIHERMIAQIADADVAVVDITTQNPNVFYELGVRHALRDRVTVLLRRKGTSNPFNIGGMTTISYDVDPRSAARARDAIANYVENGLLSGNKDSLVYTVLPGLKASRDPKPIDESGVEEYDVPNAQGKRIGIFKGNLRHANLVAALREGRAIDIWVNSENVNMQMARPYEASASGLIRYLGAKKDATGTIVEDSIANELRERMGNRQLVNPGEVVSTGAGALQQTHRVKRIYHAAAVYGVVGAGYHGIANVEQCITNALARADLEARGLVHERNASKTGAPRRVADSILFPVLGAGTARGDIIQNARRQLATAISYLRSRAEFTCINRVYFLARDETVLGALRVALAELGVISRKRSAKKASRPAVLAKRSAARTKPARASRRGR
jgi:hypothetical protein